MAEELNVGDRVILRSPKWDPEMEITRHGAIEEVYYGKPSCGGLGEKKYAVRWDEGDQGRDFIGVRLEREPIPIPTIEMPHEHVWRIGVIGEFQTGHVGCSCGAEKPFDPLSGE